jgi:hypothetical protein
MMGSQPSLVRCMLCCGVVSQPQQLPCDHVFCRKCWIKFRTLVFRASIAKSSNPHDNDLTDLLCPVCATVITDAEVEPKFDADLGDIAERVELRPEDDDAALSTCEVCLASAGFADEQKYCVDFVKCLCYD